MERTSTFLPCLDVELDTSQDLPIENQINTFWIVALHEYLLLTKTDWKQWRPYSATIITKCYVVMLMLSYNYFKILCRHVTHQSEVRIYKCTAFDATACFTLFLANLLTPFFPKNFFIAGICIYKRVDDKWNWTNAWPKLKVCYGVCIALPNSS